MNRKTGQRRPRVDGVRTREALITAAVDELSEASLEATSIRAIGAKAGVDPALVGRYFGSKEGLFIAALESIVEGFDVGDLFASTPIEKQGMAFARYVLVTNADSRILKMALWAAASPATADLVAEHLTAWVERQISAGLRGRDKAARATAILAIITGAATARWLYDMDAARSPSYVRLIGKAVQGVIDAG